MDAPVDRLRVIAFSRPAAFVVAEGEGFFADESLAVEHTQARGSAPQLDALVRGDFDLAHTAADNIVMRVDRDGADLAVVCVAELGVAQRLVVRPEIASIGELRGKDLGVDAIVKAGPILTELGKLDAELGERTHHPLLGRGSVHASMIGGAERELASQHVERVVIVAKREDLPAHQTMAIQNCPAPRAL